MFLPSGKKSQSGFSLVELMVVVAIIGILASVAIPSVNKYMAKARQSEAKANLASVYTSEKAFFAEYTVYDSSFALVGYTPEGQVRYNVGFSAASLPAPGVQRPTIDVFSSATYCGANGVMANGCSVMNGATGVAAPAITDGMCPAGGGTAAPATCTIQAGLFRVGAGSRLLSSAASQDDWWTIDDTKVLRNTQNGIN